MPPDFLSRIFGWTKRDWKIFCSLCDENEIVSSRVFSRAVFLARLGSKGTKTHSRGKTRTGREGFVCVCPILSIRENFYVWMKFLIKYFRSKVNRSSSADS